MIFDRLRRKATSPVFLYIFLYHIFLNINVKNRDGTAPIKTQGDAAHGVEACDSASDASVKREKFLSTGALEAGGNLHLW